MINKYVMKATEYEKRQKYLIRMLRLDFQYKEFNGFDYWGDNRVAREALLRLDMSVGYEVEALMAEHYGNSCKNKQ